MRRASATSCGRVPLIRNRIKGLAQVIRPKRIYNFCLFHDLLGDIVICFATLLYHFTHIWTNLLTQCIQCQFMSTDVFLQGLLPNFPKPEKSRQKYIKIQRNGSFHITGDGPGGPRASQAAYWRGQALGRARRSPGWVPPPLVPSFGLYLES